MDTAKSETNQPTLSIVIPAYNEYPGIIPVLEELKRVTSGLVAAGLYRDVTIIVVDDGSDDQTAEAVKAQESVHLIQFEKNAGYGAALKAGFAASTTDHLAFLDADGTYPSAALPELCGPLCRGNVDIVIGSRLAGAPSQMPLVRLLGNKLFARLTSWASGKHVTDCASGMRVFKRDVLPRLYPLPDGLDFTPAMSTRAILEGLKLEEVPISYHERVGPSKLSAVTDGFRFLGSILRMTTYYNPLKFFGVIGFFLLLLGAVYGLQPVFHYLQHQEVPEGYIYRLLAILTFWLSGLQIVALGILANFSLGIIHRQMTLRSKISQFFLKKSFYNRLDVIGILMVIIAVVLNRANIYEYFTTGSISGHWSYIVTGAILFLTGVQIFTVHILIRILAELKQREGYIAKDLGNKN
ncbi:glycosyltransferase [candidate division CSSED10-310 bacterium]|uniref:Glycosyltransferase n=1 Tax=candidate division CSSED10-310 bacterium TaxID=2855610 RepID=A0ABV6YZW3_UNCC1